MRRPQVVAFKFKFKSATHSLRFTRQQSALTFLDFLLAQRVPKYRTLTPPGLPPRPSPPAPRRHGSPCNRVIIQVGQPPCPGGNTLLTASGSSFSPTQVSHQLAQVKLSLCFEFVRIVLGQFGEWIEGVRVEMRSEGKWGKAGESWANID